MDCENLQLAQEAAVQTAEWCKLTRKVLVHIPGIANGPMRKKVAKECLQECVTKKIEIGKDLRERLDMLGKGELPQV